MKLNQINLRLVTFAVLSMGCLTASLAHSGVGQTAADATGTVSDTKPSDDVDTPAELPIGTIVRGRLADRGSGGKAHYWKVVLGPGRYKAVIDVRRSDRTAGEVGGNLTWLSPEGKVLNAIGSLYAGEERVRGVYRFEIKAPLEATIRYENAHTVSDYWLALYKDSTPAPVPYFVDNPGEVKTLSADNPVQVTLDGTNPEKSDAYCRIQLEPGDYKFVVEFRRADGTTGEVGGNMTSLDPDGGSEQSMANAYAGDQSCREVVKTSIADQTSFLIRLRAAHTTEVVTLKVSKQ